MLVHTPDRTAPSSGNRSEIAEIAAVTHSTTPAVRYRLRRAEEMLRELLKEELG